MYKLYNIYKDGRIIGSSNDIEYVIEFTKLVVNKAIGTEKDASSKLKQLYEDKLVLNSPNVWLHKLRPILERLGYKLEVDIKVDIK